MHFEVLTEDSHALGGLATRKEVNVYLTKDNKKYFTILMYIPNQRAGTVPLFFGLNFKGNHTISTDPGISYPTLEKQKEFRWRKLPERGIASARWPIETIMKNGYALATIYRGDIDPDFDDAFKNGVHPLFYKKGQRRPADNEWGTIAAWAWAMSCAMDYFETDKEIDASKVAVFGHSRHGKAALWAGATDPRFSLIISNCSGCGGQRSPAVPLAKQSVPSTGNSRIGSAATSGNTMIRRKIYRSTNTSSLPCKLPVRST